LFTTNDWEQDTKSMGNKQNDFTFSAFKLILPVFLGLGVIVWLFLKEFDPQSLATFKPGGKAIFFLFLAVIFMLLRDAGMIWRFRIMSDHQLSWRSAFNVHILTEFTSAITPSAVGGSGLVMLFMKKEGVDFGKGVAVTITNLFLDEIYFIIVCPLILLFVPFYELFNTSTTVTGTISTLFWSVYVVFLAWTFILFIGLFFRPTIITNSLLKIFDLRFLKKWKPKVESFSTDLLISSIEISKKKIGFWLRLLGLTIFNWTCRFMVVNMLFLAFESHINHWIVFGRQLILWMVIHLTPTPGGSGFYEYMFNNYYGDILPQTGQLLIIIAIWRIITYYNYLIAGIVIIPHWMKPKNLQKTENK
jgi:glycosyltransferase 2 family protein